MTSEIQIILILENHFPIPRNRIFGIKIMIFFISMIQNFDINKSKLILDLKNRIRILDIKNSFFLYKKIPVKHIKTAPQTN